MALHTAGRRRQKDGRFVSAILVIDTCLYLPGCMSAGDTIEEAMIMAREARSLHLYGILEDGKSVPEASDLLELRQETDAF